MRAAAMVIDEIRAQEPTEMCFVEYDHVIQTLSTQGADHALDVGILPGTPRARHDLRDTEADNPSVHLVVVDVVAVA
jgi:hypothetical protein